MKDKTKGRLRWGIGGIAAAVILISLLLLNKEQGGSDGGLLKGGNNTSGKGKELGSVGDISAAAKEGPALTGKSSTGTGKVAASDIQNVIQESANAIWIFNTKRPVHSSPAIGADGTVYVVSENKKVYALNGKTGAKKWEFETGGEVRSSPSIGANRTVYVGSDDNKVYALNGKTGAKKWGFETGGAVFSSPAIGSDGTVYVGSADKKIYALNGKTGAKKWEFKTGGEVWSSPAIGSDGTIYVGSHDKKVYALHPDGTNKTESKGLLEVTPSPATRAAGPVLWEFETGGAPVRSSPAIGADGTVYVGSNRKKFFALDGKTGVKQWEFKPAGRVESSPAIGIDGTIYVGSNDKKVYALDGNTGVKKWEFETGEWVKTQKELGVACILRLPSGPMALFMLAHMTVSFTHWMARPGPNDGNLQQMLRSDPLPPSERTAPFILDQGMAGFTPSRPPAKA